MATSTLTTISDPSIELLESWMLESSRDADRVIFFLEKLGYHASPERPISLPADFLLDLGAALRMWSWEQHGLRVHIDEGFPTAREALCDLLLPVFGGQLGPSVSPPGSLTRRVGWLFILRFAWSGLQELNADVTLNKSDEDVLLEELADFLWKCHPK